MGFHILWAEAQTSSLALDAIQSTHTQNLSTSDDPVSYANADQHMHARPVLSLLLLRNIPGISTYTSNLRCMSRCVRVKQARGSTAYLSGALGKLGTFPGPEELRVIDQHRILSIRGSLGELCGLSALLGHGIGLLLRCQAARRQSVSMLSPGESVPLQQCPPIHCSVNALSIAWVAEVVDAVLYFACGMRVGLLHATMKHGIAAFVMGRCHWSSR